MIKLIKHSENLLKYEGTVKYTQSNTESIAFEGKTYFNTTTIDKETTIETLRQDNAMFFFNHIYNFNLIDYNIQIEDYSGLSNNLSIISDKYQGSTNSYVSAIIQAFDEGLLDSRINSVFSGKKDYYNYYPRYYSEQLNEILNSMEINIPMYTYGFNNVLYYTISVRTLFDVDSSLIPDNIKKMFLTKDIYIDSKNKLKEVQKLLIKKVELCNQ